MNPKVSVVIPTYNRAQAVAKAIQSVLGQTASDLEVIVVDDGSSDETKVVLQDLFGDRIRYIYQANQGVSAARNRGIAESRGEWIAFLDSDDLWEPQKLEWQFKALEQFALECTGCYTDVRLTNHAETRTIFELAEASYRHGEMTGVNREMLRLLVRPGGGGMVVCPSSVLVRTDAVKKTGGFDTKLRFSEDSEFLFRLAMSTRFCYVRLPLVLKDQGPVETRHVGVTAEWNRLEFVLRQSQIRLEGLLRLREKLPREIYRLIRRQIGSTHSGLTNCYLENGENAKARVSALKAVQFDPTIKIAMKLVLTWMTPQLARRAVRNHLGKKGQSASIL